MLRLVLAAILLVLVVRFLGRLVSSVIEASGGGTSRGAGRGPAGTRLVRDPVCGTYVPTGSSLSLTSAGSTHYFCSEECKATFSSRER